MKTTLEIQQLRVYVVLARSLNMSRAAEELKMTPSGISHCLKNLEQELGCKLFERTSRKMSLTETGTEFLIDAHEILDRLKSITAKIRSATNSRQGHIRIGASHTACQFILPPALREFRESFPEISIKIEPCTSEEALHALPNDRIDLVMGPELSRAHGLQFEFLAEDELEFVVHPLHPWATKHRVDREDISAGRLIIPEVSSDTFRLIESYFKTEGMVMQPSIEVASEEAIKRFIELDMGVGILPRWIAAREISQGLLTALPLGRRKLRRRWGILYAKLHKPTFAESLLANICQNVLKNLVAASG